MNVIRKWKRLMCAVLGHDHDMTFPDGQNLSWLFVCRRCGHSTTDIMEAA